MTTLLMLSAALPVLVRVTVCETLVVLKIWRAKGRLAGDRLTAGAVPVPLSDTVCGLPVALSAIVTAPVRVPVAVGVNVTPMVQLAPAASDAPQVLVSAKSPLAAILVMLRAALPVLVRVTVCETLVVL